MTDVGSLSDIPSYVNFVGFSTMAIDPKSLALGSMVASSCCEVVSYISAFIPARSRTAGAKVKSPLKCPFATDFRNMYRSIYVSDGESQTPPCSLRPSTRQSADQVDDANRVICPFSLVIFI